ETLIPTQATSPSLSSWERPRSACRCFAGAVTRGARMPPEASGHGLGFERERPGKEHIVLLVNVIVQVALELRESGEHGAVGVARIRIRGEAIRQRAQPHQGVARRIVLAFHLPDG